MSQQKSFEDLKFCLYSALVCILPNLQQPFDIETDASDYAISAILTHHGHLVAYHNETLSDVVRRYPTYEKEMYSIVQECQKWKQCILGNEMVIHTAHMPLQFMQTWGKLQNNRHQKWSTYLKQFHLNIKYNKVNTNHLVDCLSQPPIVVLTIVCNSCGHEMSEWPQLYNSDSNFTTTYQTLSVGKPVLDFHLQDGLLCHLIHLSVPLRKRANMIWELITFEWKDTLVWKK
jgi:hypothetical protein